MASMTTNGQTQHRTITDTKMITVLPSNPRESSSSRMERRSDAQSEQSRPKQPLA